MRKLTLPLSLFIVLLSLVSCAHKSPIKEGYYFQALGEEGDIVVTFDVERAREERLGLVDESLFSSPILSRTDRASIALTPNDVDKYPLDVGEFSFKGALEGDFPRVLVNTAIRYTKGFESVGDGGIYYYENGRIESGVPKSGILLFSQDDWYDLYETTIKKRRLLIPDDIASEMASSLIALYVDKPETLMDLGFEITKTVLDKVERSVLLINKADDDSLVLSGTLIMEDEGNARTMNTILRNQLIQSIKRSGERLDVSALSHIFNYEGNVVKLDRMSVTKEMEERISSSLSLYMEGLLG